MHSDRIMLYIAWMVKKEIRRVKSEIFFYTQKNGNGNEAGKLVVSRRRRL